MGVVDDIAVLAETDIRNKEQIVKRKSLYSKLQGQISSMDEKLKDQAGTIETLERQLVQAGIKLRVNAADTEINKKKHEAKSAIHKEELESKAHMKNFRKGMDIEQQQAKEQQKIRNKDLETL